MNKEELWPEMDSTADRYLIFSFTIFLFLLPFLKNSISICVLLIIVSIAAAFQGFDQTNPLIGYLHYSVFSGVYADIFHLASVFCFFLNRAQCGDEALMMRRTN